jgi:hypothetical protein
MEARSAEISHISLALNPGYHRQLAIGNRPSKLSGREWMAEIQSYRDLRVWSAPIAWPTWHGRLPIDDCRLMRGRRQDAAWPDPINPSYLTTADCRLPTADVIMTKAEPLRQ